MDKDIDLDSLLDDLEEVTPVASSKEVEDIETTSVTEVESEVEETETVSLPASAFKYGVRQKLKNDSEYEYSEEFKELEASTRSYIGDMFEIESKIKELRDELKERKETAKEEGVSVNNVSKAVKELTKELKESASDAKNVEDMKRFIRSNDEFYSKVIENSQG